MLTRKAYAHIPATYTPYPTATHRGNPLIEALPMRTWDLSELFIGLSHKPMPPDDKTRSLPSLIRSEETNTIRDILFHRPAYKAAARDIVSAIVEGYGHRNPLDSSDEVRRHQIGALNEDNVEHFRGLTDSQRLDRGWRGTASGCGLFGPTGSGKTSLLVALMWDWQVVICHTSYGGRPIHLKQIPVIRIQVPHDATLRTLCLMLSSLVQRTTWPTATCTVSGENLYSRIRTWELAAVVFGAGEMAAPLLADTAALVPPPQYEVAMAAHRATTRDRDTLTNNSSKAVGRERGISGVRAVS